MYGDDCIVHTIFSRTLSHICTVTGVMCNNVRQYAANYCMHDTIVYARVLVMSHVHATNVLPRVVVWCSVVQCDATWCSVVQCGAVCCSVLQCLTVWCSVLQCGAVCCSVLQCVALCCIVLQCVAVCCIVALGISYA